jgi:hypothetical protein
MKTPPTSTPPPPTDPPRPPSVTELRAATRDLHAWRLFADPRSAIYTATTAARRMRRLTRPKSR